MGNCFSEEKKAGGTAAAAAKPGGDSQAVNASPGSENKVCFVIGHAAVELSVEKRAPELI